MQIAGRGFNVRVAQQLLDHDQVDAVIQQMRGKGMPQRVRMHGFGDPGQFRRFSAGKEDGLGCERATGLAAREKPFCGAFPPPPGHQHVAERIRQHDLSVFAAFASANPDHPATVIEIVVSNPTNVAVTIGAVVVVSSNPDERLLLDGGLQGALALPRWQYAGQLAARVARV